MKNLCIAALCVFVTLSLAGCVLSGKPKTVKAAPPPPKPAVTSAAAPPPQPLSIPQTQVELPPPQPLNPEALETAPPVEQPAGPAVTQRPPRPRPAPPATQPRIDTQQPAAAPVQTAPPPETEREPVQAIVPGEDSRKLQESALGRRKEASQILATAQSRRLNGRERDLAQRARSFITQSEAAEGRGDMRQADALAERALLLARELQGGR